MARLEARDVLCAPVNRYADLPSDPQVMASGMLVEQEHPRAGRLRTLDTAIRFNRTPGGIRTPAPALGEHTDDRPEPRPAWSRWRSLACGPTGVIL